MSYARFGWEGSDVYLIGTVYPGGVHVIECCGCFFTPLTSERPADVTDSSPKWMRDFKLWYKGPFPAFTTNEDMLAHLDKHRAAGHTVPESAYEAIRENEWVMGHG